MYRTRCAGLTVLKSIYTHAPNPQNGLVVNIYDTDMYGWDMANIKVTSIIDRENIDFSMKFDWDVFLFSSCLVLSFLFFSFFPLPFSFPLLFPFLFLRLRYCNSHAPAFHAWQKSRNRTAQDGFEGAVRCGAMRWCSRNHVGLDKPYTWSR